MIKSVLFFIVGIIILALVARVISFFSSKKGNSVENFICKKCKKIRFPVNSCNCRK